MNYTRHKDILGEGIDSNSLIVGTGAIGRQLAIQLTCMGVKNLTLVDFDKVCDVNLAVQGWKESDIGLDKVDALGRECKAINKDIKVVSINRPYKSDYAYKKDTVFVCVDTITVRKQIFESLAGSKHTIIDGRMSAETCRILTARLDNEKELALYEKSIFKQEEAYPARCTSKATIYCANIAAGLMASQFSHLVRGQDYDPDFTFSIFTKEILHEQPESEKVPLDMPF